MSYYPRKCAVNYTYAERVDDDDDDVIKFHTLIWCIPKFLTVAKCKFIRICQTEYVDNIVQDEQFRLKIKFCGVNHDLIEIYYLYRNRVVLEEAMLERICIDPNGGYKSEETLIVKNNFIVVANKWQHLLSLNKEAIITASDGEFKLKFRFTVSSKVPDDVTIEQLPEQQLCNDFEDLLINSIFHDVIVKSAEGYEFKAHKGILSSRSTVLKAHFAHDTLENRVNTVVSHFDTEVLKEVLIYIYTERASRVQEMPDKLLEAAEFYHLPELKKICEEILHLELTKDNAIETLLLADLYSATYLKKLTLKFIKDGHGHLITETDAWKSLMSIDIVKALYEFIVAPPEK